MKCFRRNKLNRSTHTIYVISYVWMTSNGQRQARSCRELLQQPKSHKREPQDRDPRGRTTCGGGGSQRRRAGKRAVELKAGKPEMRLKPPVARGESMPTDFAGLVKAARLGKEANQIPPSPPRPSSPDRNQSIAGQARLIEQGNSLDEQAGQLVAHQLADMDLSSSDATAAGGMGHDSSCEGGNLSSISNVDSRPRKNR